MVIFHCRSWWYSPSSCIKKCAWITFGNGECNGLWSWLYNMSLTYGHYVPSQFYFHFQGTSSIQDPPSNINLFCTFFVALYSAMGPRICGLQACATASILSFSEWHWLMLPSVFLRGLALPKLKKTFGLYHLSVTFLRGLSLMVQ
jgi:hypothetical protein